MLLPAVTVPLMAPDVGAVNVAAQTMELPFGSGVEVGTVCEQFTVAPLGNPVIEQVAASAALGPALVQVNEPLTVLPATAVAGKVAEAVMSAESARVICTDVGAPAGTYSIE